jgi:hypothetical protein
LAGKACWHLADIDKSKNIATDKKKCFIIFSI